MNTWPPRPRPPLALGLLAGALGAAAACHGPVGPVLATTPGTPAQTAGDLSTTAGAAPPAASQATALDPARIETAIGRSVSVTDDGVIKVTWPRTEVAVKVDGVPLPAPAGVTSWAAFAATSDTAMVMGDTVVFQDEVDAAMDAAFAHGLSVTALHNHFFFDEPKVYFMHIGGHGAPEALAAAVRHVWEAIAAVRKAAPAPATAFAEAGTVAAGPLDAHVLSTAIGAPAKESGGVIKLVIGRDAVMHDTPFGASMGLTTWVAFTGSDAMASVDGDFAMTAGEVQPVLHALRQAGIHVVAVHNHMIGEAPAYYFTHFWARGPALQLARGVRRALDAQRAAAQRAPGGAL